MAIVEKREDSVTPERMLEFAAFLRDSPNAAELSTQELAKRFNLPEEIVDESLAVARLARHQTNAREESGSGRFWSKIGKFFERVPEFFATQILGISLVAGSGIGFELWNVIRHKGSSSLLFGAFVIVFFLACLSYAAFNKARLRYAVAGAAIAAGAISVIQQAMAPLPFGAPWTSRLLPLFAQIFVLTIVGSAFMVASSVVGGLYRLRQQDKAEAKLDRLQLLQRIFRLQERLENHSLAEQRPVRVVTWLRSVSDHWLLTAFTIGVGLAIVEMAGVSLVGSVRPTGPLAWQPLLIGVVLMAISVLSYALAGYLAGSWWKGLLSGAIVSVSGALISLLPLPGWGVAEFSERYQQNPGGVALEFSVSLLLALFGGIGATVDRRLQHEQRIQVADRAAVLSEIVRYQQLLATGATDVCVVAIDCVGSTRMKHGADPLAVEISFRQLHEFLERIVLRHGGVVKSQVGDMAIAEFQCVADGYAASRTIQSQLGEFNRASNKLATPFRVRVGIHCGRLFGTVEEVQFSRVIDVAAHLEKVAPAGGIALSDDAAKMLETDQFIELAHEVDGHRVFLSPDPTS